jgi:hypothetical protein
MAASANSDALAGVPVLSRLVIPRVTVASLVVYGVMGGIGYGLRHHGSTKALGSGLVVAAFIGAGYAVSHAIVANVSPETFDGVDEKGP